MGKLAHPDTSITANPNNDYVTGLIWNTYAFLADNREEIRSYRKTHAFERRSIRSIPLRFSWNCLCTVGFKRNNHDPERYRLQSRPIDQRSSLDENAAKNDLDPRRRVSNGNQRQGELSK